MRSMVVVMILPFVAKNTDFFKKFLELLSGYSLKPDILPAVLYNMNTILDKRYESALQQQNALKEQLKTVDEKKIEWLAMASTTPLRFQRQQWA
jgi:hypothetical protein